VHVSTISSTSPEQTAQPGSGSSGSSEDDDEYDDEYDEDCDEYDDEDEEQDGFPTNTPSSPTPFPHRPINGTIPTPSPKPSGFVTASRPYPTHWRRRNL
jgi:hypothetical protein